ncbi:inner nuclear membrane protein enriched at telomere/subtelomere region [Gryganskiella cystojenkinii]|nr:inner nuclear membrane protein enriched at telomere/subtelomere region [Gryganskiella cystojenkinii]
MAPSDMPHYLHPDFDPWSIKMDLIREILLQHHVQTPTGSVKKQQLVDLFNEHIKPQVPELDRNSKEAQDESDASPPPAPARLSRSKSTTATRKPKVKEDATTETKPTATKPRLGRSASRQSLATEEELAKEPVKEVKLKRSNSRAKMSTAKSDNESKTEDTPTRGRGRLARRATLLSDEDNEVPARSSDKKETKSRKKVVDKSNFSDENPFQSESESDRRRSRSRDTTSARSVTRSQSRTRQSTRKPLGIDKDTTTGTKDHVFKIPDGPAFSHFMRSTPSKSNAARSTTPSSVAQSTPRRLSVSDMPEPKALHLNSSEERLSARFTKGDLQRFLGPALVALSAILLSYGVWYRQTRIEVGFCTPATTQKSTAWYYPSCIPCPDHATCISSDVQPICPPEYILKPQLFSFGNLLPLSPVCVLNKAKEYQSLQVADTAEKLLHNHAGNIECSMTRDSFPANSAGYRARRGITVDDLRHQLEQLKSDSVSDEDFSQYWDLALRELRRRPNKVSFEEGVYNEDILRSLKPSRSLGCIARQALIGLILKFKLVLGALLLSAAAGLVVKNYITRRRKASRVINGLVQNVLTKLSDQAHYYYVDPVIYPEPYLPQMHLRDVLLADVHSPSQRQEIWDNVSAAVERNSNVRTSSQEYRGEPHRVWEWVGASGVLSDQAAGHRGGHHRHHIHHGRQNASGDNGYSDIGGTSYGTRGVPKIAPRTGPNGSFFGIRRQDSEYMNPTNPLYPSLPQDYATFSQE